MNHETDFTPIASAMCLDFEFSADARSFDVYEKDNRSFGLKGLGGSIEVNGKLTSLSECVSSSMEKQTGTSFSMVYRFENPGLSWRWDFEMKDCELEVTATILNNSDMPVTISNWNVLHAKGGSEGAVRIGEDLGNARFFRWLPWDMRVELLSSERGCHSSNNLLHLFNPKSNRSLLCGFTTLDRLASQHLLQYSEDMGITEYKATCTFGEYQLLPGSRLASETLSITLHEDPYQALEFWADRINRQYRPVFADLPPVGWIGGWTDPFNSRNDNWEKFALDNASAIRRKLKGFDVGYIWTSQSNLKDYIPGNWLAENRQQIPSGLEVFFQKMQQMDFHPGLWIAPFWFYSEAEGMLERCKEFIMRDKDGNAICEEECWGWQYDDNLPWYKMHKYYLDGTHPKAVEFIQGIFEYYHRIGVRYYMFDFLGIVENSQLHDPLQTPLQSGCGMLGMIRETVGKDTHIQTAVSSIPGYVGLIDAARVGRDFGEGRPLQGGPLSDWRNATHVLHDPHYSNTLSFLQNVAANYFTHRKLYMNDFNLLTIDKPMPLEHARIAVTIFGLGGGSPLMLGDNYINMDDSRLRLAKLCLPRTQQSAKPLDLFEHAYPEDYCRILTLSIDNDWDSYRLVSVFNMDNEPYGSELDLQRLGFDSDEACRIYEFWTEEYVGTYSQHFSYVIPPNSCRLFRISKARKYPWLLATDMHIQQGAVEMKELEWDQDNMRLSGIACRPAGENGNLFFLMPRKFAVINNEGLGLLKELLDMNVIIRMPMHFNQDNEPFELRFEPWELGCVTPKHFFPYSTEAEWLDYIEKNRKPRNTRVVE